MANALGVGLLKLSLPVVSSIAALSTSLQHLMTWTLGKARFQPRHDDIFVATFPKSGTTLLQMMLYQMTTDGSMDIPHIEIVSPHAEMDLIFGNSARWNELPSPRIFKTHAEKFRMLPGNGKYIYVIRDPRDVALSSYHHLRMVTGRDLPLAPTIDQFIDGRTRFGSWFKHVESWLAYRNDPRFLFLRYEEMISDLEGTARKVAAFCGIPLDEASLPRILDRCSLEFMKQHNDKFDPRLRRTVAGRSDFIREGKAGKGRLEMTAGQQERIETKVKALAAKIGITDNDLLPAELSSSSYAGSS